jgi:hypothetical protein
MEKFKGGTEVHPLSAASSSVMMEILERILVSFLEKIYGYLVSQQWLGRGTRLRQQHRLKTGHRLHDEILSLSMTLKRKQCQRKMQD